MESLSFVIPGAVGLAVTMTEQSDGSLRFDLVNEGEIVADLRGLFFDVVDPAILSTLSVAGAQVTRVASGDDAVVNLGNGVNMNGAGEFDFGLAFGTSGIGKDDISSTSFTLTSSAGALDLQDFAGVEFGVRFTSVGDADGARGDSLKLVGESPDLPEFPPIDFPPIDFPPWNLPPIWIGM